MPGFRAGEQDTEFPAAAALGDAASNPTTPLIGSCVEVFNGTTWDRIRTNAAGVLSGTTQPFAILSAAPGEWSVTSLPAANTQATASRAAGASGVRHVARSITAVLAAGTTAPAAINLAINLIDGASGGTTFLWRATVSLAGAVGVTEHIEISGLNIVGTAATAMTLEFSAAGGANTFESVTLSGYSV